VQEKDKLHCLDEQLRTLKEKLHGTVWNCLNHMLEGFEKIQEALVKQYEQEKLCDNETQELQKSLKELQVNHEQLHAEQHNNTLGNTV
jgi:hypothetical protein